ncbi:conserved hypothetical protein protein (plasmid) [Bacillus cereus G9241]|nr:conserved hypothetical protein protein [Bacillus cereus G9241]
MLLFTIPSISLDCSEKSFIKYSRFLLKSSFLFCLTEASIASSFLTLVSHPTPVNINIGTTKKDKILRFIDIYPFVLKCFFYSYHFIICFRLFATTNIVYFTYFPNVSAISSISFKYISFTSLIPSKYLLNGSFILSVASLSLLESSCLIASNCLLKDLSIAVVA